MPFSYWQAEVGRLSIIPTNRDTWRWGGDTIDISPPGTPSAIAQVRAWLFSTTGLPAPKGTASPLEMQHDANAWPILRKLLRDPDPKKCAFAAYSTGELGWRFPDLIPELSKAIEALVTDDSRVDAAHDTTVGQIASEELQVLRGAQRSHRKAAETKALRRAR